jgi:hypothetical protein
LQIEFLNKLYAHNYITLLSMLYTQTHNYITFLHMLYTQTHSSMHTITYHYFTCCTHKHTALCTQLHTIISHDVHTNKQLYAHSYRTLLPMLNKQTHNYITFFYILYTQTHTYMHTITPKRLHSPFCEIIFFSTCRQDCTEFFRTTWEFDRASYRLLSGSA